MGVTETLKPILDGKGDNITIIVLGDFNEITRTGKPNDSLLQMKMPYQAIDLPSIKVLQDAGFSNPSRDVPLQEAATYNFHPKKENIKRGEPTFRLQRIDNAFVETDGKSIAVEQTTPQLGLAPVRKQLGLEAGVKSSDHNPVITVFKYVGGQLLEQPKLDGKDSLRKAAEAARPSPER